jgi:hypothetical protein
LRILPIKNPAGRSFCFLCFLTPALHLLGQSSVYGRFEADFTAGCSPLKVVITETDTFSTETVRQYDFEGDGVLIGFEPEDEVSYTFSQPGSYAIVQVINVDIVPKRIPCLWRSILPRILNLPYLPVKIMVQELRSNLTSTSNTGYFIHRQIP